MEVGSTISRFTASGTLEDITALTGKRAVLMAVNRNGDPYIYSNDGAIYKWFEEDFTRL